ncbi:MAG TPA: hypothetical protein VMV50_02085 [Candidatus Paceibacterota bacterium]|nr:hypothetical protein [Candidatus Paceibacterota bacterium]
MRRTLTILFMTLALSLGAVGVMAVHAPVAHAQTTPPTCAPGTTLSGHSNGGPMTWQCVPNSVGNGSQSAVQSSQGVLPDPLFTQVMGAIMELFAWLVGVAAITLDNTVYYTVVTMGNYVNNLAAVGVAWRILRDIGNIVLIFGFLAIGITTILNVNWYGGGTKMLPKLLIAAVFLNFSLFITEAVIDAGNLFATEFYTQINGGVPASPSSITGGISNEGISNRLMAQLGLQNIYGAASTNAQLLLANHSFLIGFMGILLFMVTAFVMFALSFTLIARFVALVFLIIIAPIGFAGWAVPKLTNTASKWWSALFNQTITAPVLLLLLYVALAVITDPFFISGLCSTSPTAGVSTAGWCVNGWTGFVNNQNLAGFGSLMLAFLVAMGLLLAVVVVAKRMSAFGSSWATRIAGGASFGVVAWSGRLTAGTAGNVLASKRMQAWASSGRYGTKYLKRAPVLLGRGLRSVKYDVRNTSAAGKALGALGVDAGKGSALTPHQLAEAQYGVKPVKTFFKESEAGYQRAAHELDARQALQEAVTKNDSTLAQKALGRMNTRELEELDGIKKGVEVLTQNLSPQQFESLMKSDKLKDEEKQKLKDARYKPIVTAIGSGNAADVKKVLNSYSKGELESMPGNLLADPIVLDQLTDKQREMLTDSKERTAEEKNLVRNTSATGRIEADFNNPTLGASSVSLQIGKLTPQQVAKLPKQILKSPSVGWKLTPAMLVALQEEKKLSADDITTISANIRSGGMKNTQEYITTGPGAALWS